MFSSHKQLIRTPTKRGRPNKAEFTPVGVSGDQTPTLDTTKASKHSELDSEYETDQTGSSFVELEDSPRIHYGTDIFGVNDDFSTDEGTLTEIHDEARNIELLGDKDGLMKRQSDEVKKIRTDNFNLRVELVSLKKSFQDLPKSKKQLISKTIELNRTISQLERTISELRGKQDSMNSNGDALEHMRNNYESKLKEYESRMDDLRNEKDRANKNSDGLNDHIQDLQDELSSLKLQLDRANEQLRVKSVDSTAMDDKIHDLQHKADDLKDENVDLKKALENSRQAITKLSQNDEPFSKSESSQLSNALEENKKLQNKLDDDINEKKVLQDDVDRLEDEIEHLRGQNKVLQSKLSRTQKGRSKATDLVQKEVEDVYGKVNNAEGEKAELYEKIHKLEDALTNNKQGYKDDYVADIEADRQDLYDSLSTLNEKYQSLKEQIHQQKVEIDEKDKRIQKLQEYQKNSDLSDEYRHELEDKEQTYREHMASLKADQRAKEDEYLDAIARLKDEKTSLVEDYQSLQEELKALQKEHTVDPDEYERLQDDFMKLSREYSQLSARNKFLQDEYQTYKENSELLQKHLQSDIDFKTAEVNRLRMIPSPQISSSSSSSSEQIRILRNDIRDLRTRMSKITDERNSLDSENIRLKAQVEALKENEKALRKKVISTNDEAESIKLQKQIDNVKDEKEAVTLKLQKSISSLRRLQNQVDDLKDEKEDLGRTIEKLERSQKKVMEKNHSLNEDLKTLRSLRDSSKSELEDQIATFKNDKEKKDTQIKKLVNEYNDMKNELFSKLEDSHSRGKVLEQQIDNLEKKLERFNIREEMLMNRETEQSKEVQYPPTPRTPTEELPKSADDDNTERLQSKIYILKCQEKLYQLKIQDLQEKICDMRYANEYLSRKVKCLGTLIKRNVTFLESTGPNSSKKSVSDPKKSLAKYAYVALAVVKLSKRIQKLKDEKLQRRSLKIKILRHT